MVIKLGGDHSVYTYCSIYSHTDISIGIESGTRSSAAAYLAKGSHFSQRLSVSNIES